MAGASRSGRTEGVVVQGVANMKKWKERDIIVSPERTKVWMEPKTTTTTTMKVMKKKKVDVVYYLSKDGHLEHPHFIEVPLSSNDGLHLRDVINRLNSLRGKGMATMYSWSSKRSYKSGFVWHDLSENDFIYPAHGQEYVLKGSEFLEGSFNRSDEETASSSTEKTTTPETQKSGEIGSSTNFPVVIQRRNQSWSSIDLHEYKVYKTESLTTGEYSGKAAADAGTQTDEKRRRRRIIREEEEDDEEEKTPPPPFDEEQQQQQTSTELSREEISPPPSSSSPETLESLIKADGRISSSCGSVMIESDIRNQTANNNHPSGRVRASTVLKQLISCGSFTVKEEESCDDGGGGGSTTISAKDQRLSLIQSHYRDRLTHHIASSTTSTSTSNQKEYFSGSIIINEESKEEEEVDYKENR